MHSRRCLTLAMLILSLAAYASTAGADDKLVWKFSEGQELNYVLDRSVEGSMDLSGSVFEFTMGMGFDVTWKVKSVADDGAAVVEQTVDRIRIKMDSPLGGALDYDSAKETAPEGPIWEQMKPVVTSMLKQSFAVNISPQGVVSDIKLPQSLVDHFAAQEQAGADGAPRRRGGMPGMEGFSENGIKQLIARMVQRLPDESAADDSWTLELETEQRGAGVQTEEITYKLDGDETYDGKPVVKIAAKSELFFEPADDAQMDVEITEQKGVATILFDKQAGCLVKSSGTQEVTKEMVGRGREIVQQIKETATMTLGKTPE